MPTAGGPNTLGESNLVFAYDTGDVKNSYRGEPTTNVLLNTNLDTGWAKDYHYDIIIGDTYPKPPGITSQAVSFKTANSYGYWYSYGDYAPQADNTTYTISIWARTVGSTFYIQPYTADNGESHRVWMSAQAVIGNGEWQRLTWNNAYTTPSGNDSDSLSFHFPSTPIDQRCWILAPQLEAKTHATPFVNGTRSATQGLLPLIGNSTIDLSNVSFDSNAKKVFDGTNDYVDCGAIQPFDLSARNVTWEAIVKFNDTSGVEAVVTRWDNTTGMIWWVGRYPTTKMHVAFIINGSYYDYYSDGDIGTTAGYHHIVATLNNTVLTYYINGVLDSTDTVTAGTWTSDPDPSLIIGAQNQGAAANMNGEIPVVKIYNRALTAQEVKQNYQQYKTRFNLS